jgi:hypothetical protein
VRVGLLIERLPGRARRHAETRLPRAALVTVGYIAWAAALFVYESWQFEELAQGLIQHPDLDPADELRAGALVFFVAVLDDLVCHLAGARPSYLAAEQTPGAGRPTSPIAP